MATEVQEWNQREGKRWFDRACRDLLGISGKEFTRRFDANDIPTEWSTARVSYLRVFAPLGR